MAAKTSNGEKDSNSLQARVILQQCLSARLQVQPATEELEAEFVNISRGLVVYICFLKDANKSVVEKIVKSVLNAKLSQNAEGRLVSVLDLPGDLLIIPQATLGGKLKGKGMQYHTNIDKTLGEELYKTFVAQCMESFESNQATKEKECAVKYGTYGNLQVLKLDTNGPFTHILEF